MIKGFLFDLDGSKLKINSATNAKLIEIKLIAPKIQNQYFFNFIKP